MSLQDEIDKWLKSAAGKKKIEEARKRAEHGTGLQSSEFYAMEMQKILRKHISGIRSKTTGESYLDHIAYKLRKDGAEVFFDPDEMTRPALDPVYNNELGFAVDNIAVLINNGYRAAGAVRGVDRHGVERYSLSQRSGLHFMQKAVDEFNQQFKGEVHAELDKKYS